MAISVVYLVPVLNGNFNLPIPHIYDTHDTPGVIKKSQLAANIVHNTICI